MNKLMLFVVMLTCSFTMIFGQDDVRIKDVASISGLEDIQLYGYGLVVGLDGSGDQYQTLFTNQTIQNLLKNLGIELPAQQLRVRNVAGVMVTGTLKPFKRKGTRFDVTVSSLGDATSLDGGTLLLTTLQGPDGVIYGSGQGALSTGGYDVRYKGSSAKKNHVLVGKIPDGAIVQKEYVFNVLDGRDISLSLTSPDFSSAVSMAAAINVAFKNSTPIPVAKPIDAATVRLNYDAIARDSIRNYFGLTEFISKVENVTFTVASQARVVMNERTGTIVAGGNVRISEVAVTHGGIKIEVVNNTEVVEPQPYSEGKTTIASNPDISIEEKTPEMVVLKSTTTVSELAQTLNSLGVSPRDVISIFQAIKEAGALQGQLIIM